MNVSAEVVDRALYAVFAGRADSRRHERDQIIDAIGEVAVTQERAAAESPS